MTDSWLQVSTLIAVTATACTHADPARPKAPAVRGTPAASVPLPPGGYLQSCQGCDVAEGVLRCSCPTRLGELRQTTLTLRECEGDEIANWEGTLSCARAEGQPPDESFVASCTACDVRSSRMTCKCRSNDGKWVRTSIDLDACRLLVSNCDGKLTCGPCSPGDAVSRGSPSASNGADPAKD